MSYLIFIQILITAISSRDATQVKMTEPAAITINRLSTLDCQGFLLTYTLYFLEQHVYKHASLSFPEKLST